MELEVGMYVRTKGGEIHKVTNIIPFYENDELIYEQQYLYLDNKNSGYKIWLFQDYILKASHNIIDLIQVGDYVNGGRVVEHTYQPGRLFVECIYVGGKEQTTIENYSWELTSKYVEDEPDAIKSIVTKEMFESMSYKVQD